MRLRILLAILAAGTLCVSGDEPVHPTGFLAITEENDSLGNPFGSHQDRHYTSGLKIVWFGSDLNLPGLTSAISRHLPAIGIHVNSVFPGLVLVGQNIYTPADLLTSTPVPNDHPYGGWLYTGAVLQRRGETDARTPVLENFEINLGIVGPHALGAESQKTIHRWFFPDEVPQGWRNQLRTEPGLVLKYGRLWRLSPDTNTARYVDFIPRVGAALGNVQTFAAAGATVRLGVNLPDDFGPQINDSTASVNGGATPHSPPFHAYAFGGVEGRAVGYNIFLDGNTYRRSASIDKEPFVADLSWGLAFELWHHIQLSYTRVLRTRAFVGQRSYDYFGSLTAKINFCF